MRSSGCSPVLRSQPCSCAARARGSPASSHREAPLIIAGPGRGQHGRVRVREPGPARHGHDRRQLHPARGARRRAELRGSATTCSTRSRSTTTGDGGTDMTYQFRLPDADPEPEHVPLQHRPDRLARRRGLERQQTYTVTQVKNGNVDRCSAEDLPTPPVNIGPRSTPNYESLCSAAVHDAARRHQGLRRPARRPVLRRPRLGVRPRRPAAVQPVHVIPLGADGGRRRRPPATTCTRSRSRSRSAHAQGDGRTTDGVGVYASASRQRIRSSTRTAARQPGRWVQVSRLGNPLVNEVVIPLGQKDRWNASEPARRRAVRLAVPRSPEVLGARSTLLYPGSTTRRTTGRGDLRRRSCSPACPA